MDFDRLARQHRDAVYREMVRVCGNHEDAEDVLVQALLSAYRALDQLREEAAFKSWLARIGARLCGRMRHREELRPFITWSALAEHGFDPAAEGPTPEDQAAEEDLRRCVKGALAQLTEPYREVYVRRELEGMSAEETAVALGISVPAVKSRLHRARATVRDYLDQNACAP